MIGHANSKTSGWMVLVMDDESTRVISSILTMYDIMERNVSLVERLSMKRQNFPDMDVVYLVAPKTDSVRLLLSDFESKSKAKYKNIHLFFLDTVYIRSKDLLLFFKLSNNYFCHSAGHSSHEFDPIKCIFLQSYSNI